MAFWPLEQNVGWMGDTPYTVMTTRAPAALTTEKEMRQKEQKNKISWLSNRESKQCESISVLQCNSNITQLMKSSLCIVTCLGTLPLAEARSPLKSV